MSIGTELGPRRRRRTPEVAQKEIIEAAEALLRERPFRELTVDEVMRRTGLSRPSFYVYFKDRHDLVLRVVQHLGSELFTPSNWWYEGEGDGAMLARKALGGVVSVYEQHGPVFRALADAAADDPDVESAYSMIVQSFIDATAKHIDDEIAAGQIEQLDTVQISTALVWMTERYLYLSLGADPKLPTDQVAETLRTIWIRTLYARG